MITFKEYLTESAKSRAMIKRIADNINSDTNNKFKATVTTKTGSLDAVLSIVTPDNKIPSEIYQIFKSQRIGIGDKTSSKNDDGTVTIKFFVMEV